MMKRILVIIFCLLATTAQAQRNFSLTKITLEIAPTGSDSQDGIAAPLATIGRCIALLQRYYDAPQMECHLQPGAYGAQSFTCMGGFVGAPEVGIIGNPDAPQQILVDLSGMAARDGCIMTLSGFTLWWSVGACSQLVLVGQGAIVDLDHMVLGPCPGGATIQADDGAKINFGAGNQIAGNAANFAQANNGGIISFGGASAPVEMPHLLGFTQFAYVNGGRILFNDVPFIGPGAGTGSSGAQYFLDGCGVVSASGTTIPGTAPGIIGGCGRVFP